MLVSNVKIPNKIGKICIILIILAVALGPAIYYRSGRKTKININMRHWGNNIPKIGGLILYWKASNHNIGIL